eukprot:2961191-Rhodomonas_salina.1
MELHSESERWDPEGAVALQRKKSLLRRSWRRIASVVITVLVSVPAGCSCGTTSKNVCEEGLEDTMHTRGRVKSWDFTYGCRKRGISLRKQVFQELLLKGLESSTRTSIVNLTTLPK